MSTVTPSPPLVALIELTAHALRGTESAVHAGDVLARAAQDEHIPPARAALITVLEALVNSEDRVAAWAVVSNVATSLVTQGDVGDELSGVAQALATLAAAVGRPADAADWQRHAVAQRTPPQSAEAAQEQSIILYNLAHYLAADRQWAEAATTMQSVVALDEAFDLPDLASDRAVLAGFERKQNPMALLGIESESPSEYATSLHEMADEVERFVASMREEQDELVSQVQHDAAAKQADALVAEAIAAKRDGTVADLLSRIDSAIAVWSEGNPLDSPLGQLAQFARAVATQLQGAQAEAVPDAYAEQWVRLKEAAVPPEEGSN